MPRGTRLSPGVPRIYAPQRILLTVVTREKSVEKPRRWIRGDTHGVEDFQLQVRLVEEGQGLGFLPRYLVEDSIDEGRLRVHDVTGFCMQRSLVLVSAPGLEEGSFAAVVRDAVLACAGPEAGEPTTLAVADG